MALLFVGLQQLAPLHLAVRHLSNDGMQRWPGSAGVSVHCLIPKGKGLLGRKLPCPKLSDYLLAGDQRAALGYNLFVGVKVLCHVGSLQAGSSRR